MKRKDDEKCLGGSLSHEVSALVHFLGSTASLWAHRTTPRRQPLSVAWEREGERGRV